ncbi:hypothetical protein JCM3774_005194 [Rhodotorula dairenensis]
MGANFLTVYISTTHGLGASSTAADLLQKFPETRTLTIELGWADELEGLDERLHERFPTLQHLESLTLVGAETLLNAVLAGNVNQFKPLTVKHLGLEGT